MSRRYAERLSLAAVGTVAAVALSLANVSRGEVTWHWEEVPERSPIIRRLEKTPKRGGVRITKEDGLPSDLVTAITRLPGGGMALGGRHGLVFWQDDTLRMWGTRARILGEAEELPAESRLPISWITGLLVTRDGSLWVASSGGLCRLKDGRWWSLKGEAPRAEGSAQYLDLVDKLLDIFTIQETSRGVVIGSRCAGITIINSASGHAETIWHNTDGNNWVTGVAEDREQNLWIGIIELGVWCYDGEGFTRYAEDEPWVPQNRVRSLAIDSAGRLWVGTHRGLGVRMPDGSAKWFTESDLLPSNHVWHIWPLMNGHVWVHTSDGMVVYDGEAWSYAKSKEMARVAGCPYTGFFEEDTGTLWFGGWRGAVRNPEYSMARRNPVAVQLDVWKQEVEQTWPSIRRLPLCAVDKAKRVYGHRGRRLLRYDGIKWEDLSGIVGDYPINFIRADSRGRVWVGSSGAGVIGYDGETVMRFNADIHGGLSPSVMYAMAEDSQGTLYFATQGGLFQFADGEWGRVPGVASSQIMQVLVDHEDRVWYTDTFFGLFCLRQGGNPRHMWRGGILRGRRILSVSLTGDGRLRVDAGPGGSGQEEPTAFVFEEGEFVPYRPMSLVVPILAAAGLAALFVGVLVAFKRARAKRKPASQVAREL
jgi:ligand-binding sensor domain-containing protein